MQQRIIQTGKVELTARPEMGVSSNTFDLSSDLKTSFNIGELIPIFSSECLPGDVIHSDVEGLVRLAPMLSPVMQRMSLTFYKFFVPNRINWPGWEEFISPLTSGISPPTMPTFSPGSIPNVTAADLHNHLGLPIGPALAEEINCLRHAAYNRIIADWFKDENFGDVRFIPLQDGDNNNGADFNVTYKQLRDRDYFTSLLPFAQKGDAVVIPVTVSATGGSVGITAHASPWLVGTVDGSTLSNTDPFLRNDGSLTPLANLDVKDSVGGSKERYLDPNGSLTGTLDAGTFTTTGTINDLRTAAAIQRWLEVDTFGTRYIELIKNHFGTSVEDFRLQRAEFIGSTVEPIVISEVLQTGETNTTPQGNMAGHGISVHRSGHHGYHVKEHGYYMILAVVRPTNSYSQGLHRSFSRLDRLDFAWPELANIGYQEVPMKEIYYTGSNVADNVVFGYNPRYQEYRTEYSRFSGEFATNLDYWHLGLKFTSHPTLTEPFMYWRVADTTRIFAVIDDVLAHLYCHFYHSLKMSRKLPRFSQPILR